MNCQNFGSKIRLGDMGIGSLDEDWIDSAKCLEYAPTFNPHFQLFSQVEWSRLKFGLKAINEAFQNPAFAPCTFFQGWECGDE
jgi:hypothetical protein